jgi:hypothetical protein
MNDKELFDWLEAHPWHALVSDDNGHWACVSDGIQNCPKGKGAQDIATTFFIEKRQWRTGIRRAVAAAIARSGE